jgi:hypothetical protein
MAAKAEHTRQWHYIYPEMKKRIIAAVAAVASFMLVVIAGELLNSKIYPMPATIDNKDVIAIEAWSQTQSIGMWLLLLLTYLVASIVAGIVLRVIHKEYIRSVPTAVGVALTVVGAINFFSRPHPVWVIVVGLFLFLPGVFLGYHLLTKRHQMQS